MSAVTSLPLNQVRPGHEAKPPVNVRTISRAEDIAQLADTIADRIASGKPPLIEPLVVVAGPKPRGKARVYFVANGNRRLEALQLLVDREKIAADVEIPVIEHAPEDGAEISLATATMAMPLHPVEQFEAFARIAAERQDRPEADRVDFIARRFGLPAKAVRQRLALGNLAKPIRDAWRDGKVNQEAAQAFTIEPDLARQEAVFEDLGKSGSLWGNAVKTALTRDRVRTNENRFSLVGEEAYLAAGGTLSGDLFSEARYVTDRELFDRLYAEAREAKRAALQADGYGLVVWSDETAGAEQYKWERVTPPETWTEEAAAERDALNEEADAIQDALAAESEGEAPEEDSGDLRTKRLDEIDERQAQLEQAAKAAGFPAEQRPNIAAILFQNWDGASVSYRRMPDGAAPAHDEGTAEGADAPEPAEAEPASAIGATRSSAQPLSEIANKAAAATLNDDPDLAMACLIAAWIARNGTAKHDAKFKAPFVVNVKAREDGTYRETMAEHDHRARGFADLLADMLAMNRAGRMAVLASLVAGTLDLTENTLRAERFEAREKNVSREASTAFLRILPPAFRTHARQMLASEAEVVFADWPKAALVAAIRDMDGDEAGDRAEKMKRHQSLEVAIERARATGWLPAEWREPEADGETELEQDEAA